MYVCITEPLNCIAEINANCKSAYLQFHLYFSKIKFKNKDRENLCEYGKDFLDDTKARSIEEQIDAS